MSVAAGLIASRFLHFAAVLLLFGAAAFPLYAYREGERSAQSDALSARTRSILLWSAILALISGILWLSFTSANMSGSVAGAIDPGIILTVIRETDFGRVWIWRLALAAILVVVLLPKQRTDALALIQIAGAALLLTSIAETGHSGADASSLSTLHVAADSLHLLAAGAWLGGLVPLALVLVENEATPSHRKLEILRRFSHMGYLAVAALVVSGVLNAWFLVGSIEAVLTTSYGQWLLAKIAVFLAMLALAAANRFWLVPGLAAHPLGGPAHTLSRLKLHVSGEQALGVAVVAIVAFLGTLAPANG